MTVRVSTRPQVERLVFVSGRLYYDLEAERRGRGDTKTAIVLWWSSCTCPSRRSRSSWLCTRTLPTSCGLRMSLLTRVSGRSWHEPAAAGLPRCVLLPLRSCFPGCGTGVLHAAEAEALLKQVFEG